jgi:hypothetical protein
MPTDSARLSMASPETWGLAFQEGFQGIAHFRLAHAVVAGLYALEVLEALERFPYVLGSYVDHSQLPSPRAF